MTARIASLALLALLSGCNQLADLPEFRSCQSDEDCGDGLVCFADGCGDPGRNIAVELLASRSSGEYPQDIHLDQLRPNEQLLLYPPPVIHGELKRSTTDRSTSDPYAGGVSLQLSGESLLIPGQTRTRTTTIPVGTDAYSLPVGTGYYTLSATADDPSIPPVLLENLVAQAGLAPPTDLLFPDASEVRQIDGRIVETLVSGVPPSGVTLEVQAFDALTQRAISQKATVDALGNFTVYAWLLSDAVNSYVLRVRPVDPGAFVPQKEFTLSSYDPLADALELGEYGKPVSYSGRLVTEDFEPIAGATVYVQGMVGGGGTYRSPAVHTNANGEFTLETLASPPEAPFTFWAVPPDVSRSAVVEAALEIPAVGAVPLTFVAPDQVRVTGTVLRPDDAFAAGVRVVATPIASVDGGPLPTLGDEARTGLDGRYQLFLDPAVYRLDFVPSDQLPRNSRILRVFAISRPREQEVSPFKLSRGRTAQGVVKLAADGVPPEQWQPAPYTSVRFFRLVSAEGAFTSQLLGEAVTDELGRYSITLPARTAEDEGP